MTAAAVVVPSRNRQAPLERLLEGLASQSIPADQLEVHVVLDGGDDGSAVMLERWRSVARLPGLAWHWQPRAGQAAARNAGVARTASPVVVFLDDDVVPSPTLVETHLAHHAAGRPVAVAGDAPVARRPEGDRLAQLVVWAWWEDTLDQRARPGRLPTCRDFCAGNVSVRRHDLERVGGFDERFRGYGGEDYELGYRLLQAGVEVVVERRAVATHHHRATVPSLLASTRQEGAGDVLLGRLHPELRRGLRLADDPPPGVRRRAELAATAPARGRAGVALAVRRLDADEAAHRWRAWWRRFNALRAASYWTGVLDVLGSWTAVETYRAGAPPLPRASVDLTAGLPPTGALPRLAAEGPTRLEVTAHGRNLGEVEVAGPVLGPVREHVGGSILEQLPATVATAAAPGLTGGPPPP